MDLISRQQAINVLMELTPYKNKRELINRCDSSIADAEGRLGGIAECIDEIEDLPSAQTEPCEYYALCRHGRDENKLRADLGFCEYCHEDSDGYVMPLEKNCHAFIRFGMNGWELNMKANGWYGSAKIRFCPMCGRSLTHE